MSKDEQRALEAVRGLEVWPDNSYTVLERIGNGPTNEMWVMSHEQRRFVLRMVKPQAESLNLSLVDEIEVTKAAANVDLTAALVASSASERVVLTEYINGRTWNEQDLHDSRNLERLAHVVRRVHGLECHARPLNLVKTLNHYAKLSNESEANRFLDEALELFETLPKRTQVVCHNDLTAPNIIEGGRLYLVDWEYAALGDPLFDLAVTIGHHRLNDRLCETLLFSYLGCRDVQAIEDLAGWIKIYENLRVLWEAGLK